MHPVARPTMNDTPAPTGPLRGLRVIEFAGIVARYTRHTP